MSDSNAGDELVITGIGVTSAIGQGKQDFISALLSGQHHFDIMQRAGRQCDSAFIGAEIPIIHFPEYFSAQQLQQASFGTQVALVTLYEAWQEAQLHTLPGERIGLIIGGSNFQQRTLLQTYTKYLAKPHFVRPEHAVAFLDTDLCGHCTQAFGIHGMAYTIGGASASGQLAILQAMQAVKSGQVEVCIALGALMDLSYFECQALRTLGAMGSDRFAQTPEIACRPFDQDHDGFIYGENCAAVVIERQSHAHQRAVSCYANLCGGAMFFDANRYPDPSYDGEVSVISMALAEAGIDAGDIDYVNPHGTGSKVGDPIELAALKHCGLAHAYLNTTKSITGHGISAAGIVEVAAILLQMQAGKLHPSGNLRQPIDEDFNWVGAESLFHKINYVLNLSLGFGGINTALCLKRSQ